MPSITLANLDHLCEVRIPVTIKPTDSFYSSSKLREAMRGMGTFWVAFLALSVLLGATNCAAAERPTNRLCEYVHTL